MYFPYLRGKQFEAFAVRDSEKFLSVGRIVPVFEPVSLTPSTERWFNQVADRNVKFALIVNSAHGKGGSPPLQTDVETLLDDLESRAPGFALPALEIRPDTTQQEISRFASQFASRQCVLVHSNHTHPAGVVWLAIKPLSQKPVQILREGGTPESVVRALPAAGVVLLRDGFKRCTPNASYPNKSNFGDLLYQYGSLGFDGFADFSIVGDLFVENRGGAPPMHVALHLTELRRKSVETNHFVSARRLVGGTSPMKYLDALALLEKHVRKLVGAQSRTQGITEFLDSHTRRHYPGPGKPKQWSIMHHMEIIDQELKAARSPRFI